MPKKPISFKLVKDKFLSKKFKNKNQHSLSVWFDEIAPERNWVFGELILNSHKKITEPYCRIMVIYHGFSYAANLDDNTMTLAHLNTDHIHSQDLAIESVFTGKRIKNVFTLEGNLEMTKDETPQQIHHKLYDCLYAYLEENKFISQ